MYPWIKCQKMWVLGKKNISGASLTSAGIYDLLVGVEITQAKLQQNGSVE